MYLKIRATPMPPGGLLEVTSSGLNMRSGPGTQNPPLTSFPQGTHLVTTGAPLVGNWVQVTSNGLTGWVNITYTKPVVLSTQLPAECSLPQPTQCPPPVFAPPDEPLRIQQMFIPPQFKATRPGIPMIPISITVHETANECRGACARAHAQLQARGNDGRIASWHYTVDDREIWQSIPDYEVAYHTGNKVGNLSSIGVEICVNQDGNFERAKQNAIWLICQLMIKHHIPINGVLPHKYWSGKNCPLNILMNWEQFMMQLQTNCQREKSE